MATLTPNPADDVFGNDELNEAARAIWQELEDEAWRHADEERRFEERIAFVL
jgi:hypothetical protein